MKTRSRFLAVCLLVTLGCGQEAAIEHTEVQHADVQLAIKDFDGIQELIASHKGKVVVMDCWATYCEPCMKEFPNLVALHEKRGDQVACISLSFDFEGLGEDKPEDVSEEVLKFLQSKNAAFDNVLSSTDSDTLSNKLGVEGSIPVIFVYNQQGELVKQISEEEGKKIYDEVNKLVDELLK